MQANGLAPELDAKRTVLVDAFCSWSACSIKNLSIAFVFIGFILAVIALAYLFGQLIALPIFVVAYLRFWGDCKWTTSLIYASTVFLVVWGFLLYRFF